MSDLILWITPTDFQLGVLIALAVWGWIAYDRRQKRLKERLESENDR